jgi:tRNA-splicing ligase RtcB (3'-phosphate/5'-hydroxy nucleic acid ligase)
VPIGGVVAYEDSISPSGVGFDIACGNKAVLTDAITDSPFVGIPPIAGFQSNREFEQNRS